MYRSKLIAVLASLAIASVASAGTMGFGQAIYVFPVGTGATQIQVVATGGETIQGSDVNIFIGDGGGDVGGSTTAPPFPVATNLSIAGAGIFLATDAPNETPLNSFSGGLLVARSITSVGSGTAANRTQNGVLANVSLDLTGVPAGDYPVSLFNEALGVFSDTLTSTGGIVANTLSGTIIRVQVPEPAAALLLIGALPFMRRRRMA